MRKIIPILLAVTLLLTLNVTVSAENKTNLTLSLVDQQTPVVGVTFEIYRVGEQDSQGASKLTGKFAHYPVEINGMGEDTSGEANALFAFAKRDHLTPEAVIQTGAEGTATVMDLTPGVYLIGGLPCRFHGVVYNTEPQLLILPQMDAVTGEVDPDPVLQVKFSKESDAIITRKVLKVWNDESGNLRPEYITVSLLENGEIYETVTLTAENQWRNVWEGLDAETLWQIVEDVPEHYTVKMDLEGSTIHLKNSAPEFPSGGDTYPSTPGGDIPQTGMVWWPVLMLAGLGIALVIGGVILRKGSKA